MSNRQTARRRIEQRIYRDAIGLPADSKWRSIVAMLTERGFALRVIRKRLKLSTPLNTTDRQVLEEVIFPHLRSNRAIRRILFVGCDTYTAHYQREFFPNTQYATIEPDPDRARFGAARHVVAPLEKLAEHFAPGSFDLIICNGVYGWGLDSKSQCEAAFLQCHECLAENGLLLFGWDDVARRNPVPLEEIAALKQFRRHTFVPFGSWRYLTDTPFRHTFDFYQK